MRQLMHSCLVLWNTDVDRLALRSCYKNLLIKPLCTAGINVKRYSLNGKQYGSSSNNRITTGSSDFISGIYLKETWVLKKYLYSRVH